MHLATGSWTSFGSYGDTFRDTDPCSRKPPPGQEICTLARTIVPRICRDSPQSVRPPQLELTHGEDRQSFPPGGTFHRSYIHQSFLHRTQRNLSKEFAYETQPRGSRDSWRTSALGISASARACGGCT